MESPKWAKGLTVAGLYFDGIVDGDKLDEVIRGTLCPRLGPVVAAEYLSPGRKLFMMKTSHRMNRWK